MLELYWLGVLAGAISTIFLTIVGKCIVSAVKTKRAKKLEKKKAKEEFYSKLIEKLEKGE